MYTAQMARKEMNQASFKVDTIVKLLERRAEAFAKDGKSQVTISFCNMNFTQEEQNNINYEIHVKRGFHIAFLKSIKSFTIRIGWGDKEVFDALTESYKEN